MRIVRPTDGALAAERRLASVMLCLEAGALAFGPDLAPRPPPHEPWPAIPVRPVTARGLPVTVTYRPTVGIVFYTASQAFRIAELVRRLQALLDAAPDGHLMGRHAIAATPFTVLRQKGRIAGGSALVGGGGSPSAGPTPRPACPPASSYGPPGTGSTSPRTLACAPPSRGSSCR